MLKKLVYILSLLISINGYATHNRAGDITYIHVTGLTYEFTVTTYTKDTSPADRPSLGISWGDSTPLDSVPRISKIFLGNNVNQNIYKGLHTFPGPNVAPYVISVEDPNRTAGSINIPNSVNIPFYIETELFINPFAGVNNSPILLNPPIDNACVGVPYVYNPGAVDPDGDSLYYSLQKCRGQGGQIIPNYVFPQASNFININHFTGDLIWDSPIIQGEYNIAILIEEFRNGYKIGSVLRDMQITVVPTCDPPPNITGITDTCIVAGDVLNFNINATGSSAVTLSATGIPFTIINPASFTQTTNPATITAGNFYWQTQCNHVRNSQYFVSFKAVDASTIHLVDFLTTTITVIGPSPLNLAANVQSNAINLSWSPTICSQVIGYKIYRRQGPSGWTPAYCETGVPAYTGFQLIATTSSINDTTFVDNNNGIGLISGEDYCYRIVACYPDGSQSKASDEVCAKLLKDVPIITNVSVNTTSQTNGAMYVAWSKPTEQDTIQYPGPYRYLIYRGQQSANNMILIDSTASINDTTYVDTLINTQDIQYFYRVDIYSIPNVVTRDLMGKSTVASSVYLNLTPSDNQLTLTWHEAIPWTNTQYVIYRQNPITLLYDSLNITSDTLYVDTGLANLTTYCYKVKSIGSYATAAVINPIINYSQESCAQPIDNIKPCPPNLAVTANCDLYQNALSWQNQTSGCANDVLSYKIYKKDFINDESYAFVAATTDSSYLHSNLISVAGCYVITSIDSVGNESTFSDSICVDNCPIYTLPNVFTPGKDGMNDVFEPFPYRFIAAVHTQIFNRWGLLVFETDNIAIDWNGINQTTKKVCNDGTYYYVCTVNEIFLAGIQPRVLKGFITLINNKGASGP